VAQEQRTRGGRVCDRPGVYKYIRLESCGEQYARGELSNVRV